MYSHLRILIGFFADDQACHYSIHCITWNTFSQKAIQVIITSFSPITYTNFLYSKGINCLSKFFSIIHKICIYIYIYSNVLSCDSLQPKDKVFSPPFAHWSWHCLYHRPPAQFTWNSSISSSHHNNLRWPNCILFCPFLFWKIKTISQKIIRER